MNPLKERLKSVCEVYIRESERGLNAMKGSQYWTGYHKGQRNLAEYILKVLEDER